SLTSLLSLPDALPIFWFIPIEVMTRDVPGHRVGSQVPDRLPLTDPVSQHRRGHADLRHVEEPGPLAAGQLAQRPLDRFRSGAGPDRKSTRLNSSHQIS